MGVRGEYNLRQAYLRADAIGIGIAQACESSREAHGAPSAAMVSARCWSVMIRMLSGLAVMRVRSSSKRVELRRQLTSHTAGAAQAGC